MYVVAYVCIYAYLHTSIHTRTQTCMNQHSVVGKYTHTKRYASACTQIRISVYTGMHQRIHTMLLAMMLTESCCLVQFDGSEDFEVVDVIRHGEVHAPYN